MRNLIAVLTVSFPFLILSSPGCIDLSSLDLLPVGTPFVVRGTMTVSSGGCLVWRAENGRNYYLYQDPLLDNGVFDRVTTPGVTSRLLVSTRSDLPTACRVDEAVQVTNVLEIVE
ncbi:MAG: hypothetical protein HRF43_13615 [Phycisphaerae bacterium]